MWWDDEPVAESNERHDDPYYAQREKYRVPDPWQVATRELERESEAVEV